MNQQSWGPQQEHHDTPYAQQPHARQRSFLWRYVAILAAAAVIGVGFPVGAWVATRGGEKSSSEAADAVVRDSTPSTVADDQSLTSNPADTTSPQAQRFEQLLRAAAPELYDTTYSRAHLLVAAGWVSCEARRDGASADEAAADIRGYKPEQAHAIVASAGVALCPQVPRT